MDNESSIDLNEIARILGVPVEVLHTKKIDIDNIKEPLPNSSIIARLFCEVCGLYHLVSPELAQQLGIEYTSLEIGNFYITTRGCPFCREVMAYFGPRKQEIPFGISSE